MAGGRTVATLVLLICALWTLVVIARPLVGWKLLLVAAMAGIVVLVVTIPVLATDVFLLEPTPERVLVAVIVGAAGSVLVEIVYRSVALVTRRRSA